MPITHADHKACVLMYKQNFGLNSASIFYQQLGFILKIIHILWHLMKNTYSPYTAEFYQEKYPLLVLFKAIAHWNFLWFHWLTRQNYVIISWHSKMIPWHYFWVILGIYDSFNYTVTTSTERIRIEMSLNFCPIQS